MRYISVVREIDPYPVPLTFLWTSTILRSSICSPLSVSTGALPVSWWAPLHVKSNNIELPQVPSYPHTLIPYPILINQTHIVTLPYPTLPRPTPPYPTLSNTESKNGYERGREEAGRGARVPAAVEEEEEEV